MTPRASSTATPQPVPAVARPGPAEARPVPAVARPGPAEALAELLAGNRRFVGRRPRHGHDVAAAAAASGGQQPYAVVIGCIDSRVPLEAIFDQNFGSICVVRSGGQVLDRALLGSVEFAISQLGVALVMVLGHERCGAVDATVQALRSGDRPGGSLAYLVDEIAPAVTEAGLGHADVSSRALRHHVRRTVDRLERTPAIGEAASAGRVAIVGAVYDLDTGRVDILR
ncbi:MAG TPA: carbonic anhydrase [Pilimelia sp.]|nr:carbonic anhydrase [Pilimelia sp.]